MGSKDVGGVKNIYSTDSSVSEEEASLVSSSNRKSLEKFRGFSCSILGGVKTLEVGKLDK